MPIDSRTFRSTVTNEEKSKQLRQGTLIASVGVLFMAFAGIFFPQPMLAKWGLVIFFFCFVCLAGLLPYRRLTKLESKPDEIVVMGGDVIQYWSGGKKILAISQKNIAAMSYYCHGIRIQLKCEKQATLFFPHFSKRSFEEIVDLVEK